MSDGHSTLGQRAAAEVGPLARFLSARQSIKRKLKTAPVPTGRRGRASASRTILRCLMLAVFGPRMKVGEFASIKLRPATTLASQLLCAAAAAAVFNFSRRVFNFQVGAAIKSAPAHASDRPSDASADPWEESAEKR